MASNRRNSLFTSLDWWTILLVAALAVFGWLNIYAAVYTFDSASIFDFSTFAGKQFVWMLSALVLAVIILLVNYRLWDVLAYVLYGAVFALLLVTPIIAPDIKGSHSWLALGPVRLQPAEFAKFVTALAVAKYMSQYGYRLRDWKDMIVPAALIFAPMFVIMVLQQETGSALVLGSFILVLYREGMSGYILLAALLAIILFVTSLRWGITVSLMVIVTCLIIHLVRNRRKLFISNTFFHNRMHWITILAAGVMSVLFSLSCNVIFNKVLQPHQRLRIEVLLGTKDDPRGAGYNVAQSKIAIGSGQFLGKGYLEGTQTKGGFVPEQHTDFIFCTVGEEWGFVGSTLVLLLYLAFILRLLYLAERQRDKFSQIYAYAVASIFLFHLFINVGMVLGLVPVIGIPLPFFSYGGSSLWGFTILLTILLRLDVARLEKLH